MPGTTLEISRCSKTRLTPPTRGRGPRTRARDFAPALGVVLALVAAAELLLPSTAGAISLNPIDWVGKGIDAITGGIAGVGTSIVVKGFVAILNSLFSGLEAHITLKILTWLTSSDAQSGGHITTLYGLTSGMAIGLLGAVLTVSFLRYWLSGLSLSGRGGFEAVEGLLRTIAAVGGLLAWPFLFSQLIALGNISSATILGNPALRGEVAKIINTVIFVTFAPTGVLGLFVSIVVAVAGALLFLGLLFMKVMSGAALTFLYVAMPLAIILWPIDELAWLSRAAFRAFFALVLIPVVWALIFATFAAVSVNALEFQGASGFVNQVTQPLVAIAMLWLTITIPKTLFKLATGGLGMGRHGGGFISHAGSYLAARQAGAFLAEQGLLPFGPGGPRDLEGTPVQPGAAPATGPAMDGVWMDARVPAPDPDGGDGNATGAGNVGEAVEQLAASAAGPGAGVAEAAEVAADTSSEAQDPGAASQSQAEEPGAGEADTEVPLPAGAEVATGPAVGRSRPARDNPALGAMAGPPQNEANQAKLGEALRNARNLPQPPVEAVHAAWRNLESTSPGVHQRMRDAYDSGGPKAVAREAARLSTSDQISNAQAQDLLTTARAAEHQMIEPLLGISSPASASPTTDGAPSQPARSSPAAAPPPPTTPAAREAFTREQSPHAADRDDAWRDAGPSAQPHVD